jgi:pyruvate dehydrogenase E2 component (dihydrolipoamide acetyltransferase)
VKADVVAAGNTGHAATPAPSGEAPAGVMSEAAPSAQDPAAVLPAAGAVARQELTRLQRTVARRMAESKATAPDFVLTIEVDMSEAVALRGQLKRVASEGQAVPSYNDLVIRAAALALRDFSVVNGSYRDGGFELHSRINIGMAVAAEDALVVPTVFDADQKALGQIAAETRALAERVREGTVTPPELSGGTFTVSNLGMFGIRRFAAIINPPQAAILAVGEMVRAPVVRDGEIRVATVMELTLSCDHRILYGAVAAQFLGAIRERLERPLSLAL